VIERSTTLPEEPLGTERKCSRHPKKACLNAGQRRDLPHPQKLQSLHGFTSRFSGHLEWGPPFPSLRGIPHLAVFHAIGEIDHQADDQPNNQSYPCDSF
jgi:hypothetical protein